MKGQHTNSQRASSFLYTRVTRQPFGSDRSARLPRGMKLSTMSRPSGAPSGVRGRVSATLPHLGESPSNEGSASPNRSGLKEKLKEWRARQYRLIRKTPHESTNSFGLLSDSDSSCTKVGRLWKQALASALHLAGELDEELVRDLPPMIRCGTLRSAVLGCFPDGVSLRTRLSVKTVQKLEESCCSSCEPEFRERLELWREARFQPIEVDQEHLFLFKKAFKINVASGWNRMSKGIPYIPNGNASLEHGRKEGGNWNEEKFSEVCRYDLVFSSGKPRVVTMYSSYNNSVLFPLHACMQKYIERRKWCLVGPPTPERVKELGGKDYLSFDYESATDNIKQPYVEAAVEALIERACPPLSTEEVKCLRVLCELRIEEGGQIATRGQPMGSLMSFPLLSLCNKTLVDLALADMLKEGQLSFKEWTSHPLLVNGDDLLTTEPRPLPAGAKGLASRVFYHGDKIGLKTNSEKTLSDPSLAEINSTLFSDGEVVKKANVASLYMKQDVEDVLGFAAESTLTRGGFRRVVRANLRQLACQSIKGYRNLSPDLQVVCRQDRKIRAALCSVPAVRTTSATNLFPIGPRPEGYDLTSEEEVQLIHQRVSELRPRAVEIASSAPKRQRRGKAIPAGRSWNSVKKEKGPAEDKDSILTILSRGWYDKRKRILAEEGSGYCLTAGVLPPSDLPNLASRLVDAARAFRRAAQTCATYATPVPSWIADVGLSCESGELSLLRSSGLSDLSDDLWSPFADGSEYISLG